MNAMIPSMIQNMSVRGIAELPPHITYEQYLMIRNNVKTFYSNKNETKLRKFTIKRDQLFITMMWELGGRVNDICRMKLNDIDLDHKVINLFVRKRKRRFPIPIMSDLALDISQFVHKYELNDDDYLFGFSRIFAWKLVKKYAKNARLYEETDHQGKLTKYNIHPHVFRHGLALYLLGNNVPIPVISARLCHANVFVTMQYYMKITPNLQREYLEKVQFRENVMDI